MSALLEILPEWVVFRNVSLMLLVFITVAYVTPGPNNLILMMNAIRFGIKSTIPTYFGVISGHAVLAFAIGIFYFQAQSYFTNFSHILKYLGGGYLLYLSYKLVFTHAKTNTNMENNKPLGFFHLFFFQIINPKGWAMIISGITMFDMLSPMFLPLVYFFGGSIFVFIYVGLGEWIRRTILDTVWEKRINKSMGVILAISVFIMLFW